MMGTTHAAGGALAGAFIGSLAGHPILGAGLGILGGLLPDIDHPGSMLGRKIPIIPSLISALFGHRGITHTVWFVAGVAVLAGVGLSAANIPPQAQWVIIISLLAGGVSHLILDACTRSGIQPFAPFPFHISGPVTTGNMAVEMPLTVLLLIFCVSFVF